MLIPYETEVSFDPSTAGNAVAIVHPGGTPLGHLFLRAFDVDGASNALIGVRVRRYPTKPTGGTTNSSYSFLDGAPASFAQVVTGASVWPASTASFDITTRAMTRSSGGGLVVPTANASGGALTIAPDHSLVLETLDADPNGMYTIRLFWGEQHLVLPHILPAALPAAGAYTAGTYFTIPEGWTGVTFFVSYTAAIGSTTARPKLRVSWSDGTNAFIQPIANAAIDVSAAPTASRNVYLLEEQWSSTVAAGTTIRFPIGVTCLPGATRVRIDGAEFGDVANPGTFAVTLAGA
jgi:hypothetical protein